MLPNESGIGATMSAVIYLRVSTREQAERGGESEGFSIPAQREACERKAETLGATVIEEFVDAGESARSADRPELQRMLTLLGSRPCDFVIVHKIDRLSRNRIDDVEINLVIQRAGARLVSVTENIDETPSGMLLHGIMSSIAEFYSRNLAAETRKGMLQKAKSGGTPGIVPFGYLNVRVRTDDGREIRTVAIDPDRAEHVRWIYEMYATGEWTMTQIRDELVRRDVTSLPRPRRPARPLATSHIETILHNRYYVGMVRFDGVWHQGRHEPLVSEELWQQVQEVSAGRVRSREKPQQHPHYLKGSVACGQCGELLGLEIVRNGRGNRYPYFYCLGRKKRRTNCDFRAVPIQVLEELVERHWASVTIDTTQRQRIREMVLEHINKLLPERDRQVLAAERRMKQLKNERDLLLRAHYAGAVPLDQLCDEQNRIAEALGAAEREVSARRLSRDELTMALDRAIGLLENAFEQYKRSTAPDRRRMNQAVYDRLYVCDDEIADAELSALFARLLASDLPARLRAEETGCSNDADAEATFTGTDRTEGKNLRPEHQVVGSNFPTLVALSRFCPNTSSPPPAHRDAGVTDVPTRSVARPQQRRRITAQLRVDCHRGVRVRRNKSASGRAARTWSDNRPRHLEGRRNDSAATGAKILGYSVVPASSRRPALRSNQKPGWRQPMPRSSHVGYVKRRIKFIASDPETLLTNPQSGWKTSPHPDC